MAVDYYLQLDGIKGESADSKHKDWIECTGVNWAITQPIRFCDRRLRLKRPAGITPAAAFARGQHLIVKRDT